MTWWRTEWCESRAQAGCSEIKTRTGEQTQSLRPTQTSRGRRDRDPPRESQTQAPTCKVRHSVRQTGTWTTACTPILWHRLKDPQNRERDRAGAQTHFWSGREIQANSLLVQWLGLRAFTAQGLGLIPGQFDQL